MVCVGTALNRGTRSTIRSQPSRPASSPSFSPALQPASCTQQILEFRALWRLPEIALLLRALAWPIRPTLAVMAYSPKYLAAPARPACAPASACSTPPSKQFRLALFEQTLLMEPHTPALLPP